MWLFLDSRIAATACRRWRRRTRWGRIWPQASVVFTPTLAKRNSIIPTSPRLCRGPRRVAPARVPAQDAPLGGGGEGERPIEVSLMGPDVKSLLLFADASAAKFTRTDREMKNFRMLVSLTVLLIPQGLIAATLHIEVVNEAGKPSWGRLEVRGAGGKMYQPRRRTPRPHFGNVWHAGVL